MIGGPYAGFSGSGRFHNSGVWLDISWNPDPWFAIENYTGLYKLPDGVSLIADIPGGKIVVPKLPGGRVMPYAAAGFGFGLFTERAGFFLGSNRSYYHFSGAARYGVGTDVRLNDIIGLRVDASRMALNLTHWTTSWNISGGVVFPVF